MEFHMINMMYAALPMLAQTKKTTFSCKDDCMYIDEAHTALDIFPTAPFILLCCLLFSKSINGGGSKKTISLPEKIPNFYILNAGTIHFLCIHCGTVPTFNPS